MEQTPILYSFRRCPYAMRARMAIAASGAIVRLREVLLKDKPPEMIAVSAKATVPVLVDGARVIDESLAIMDWALTRRDPEAWLARKDDALIAANDGSFKHHLDRYKYASRYNDADTAAHRDAGLAFLQQLDARLTGDYLHGAERGVTDIAVFPFVRQFRIADPDWFDAAPIANVRRWLSALTASALFASAMDKYPSWKNTGEEFVFPQR